MKRLIENLNDSVSCDDDVLDICCGNGRLMSKLTGYNSILGVDVYEPYLEVYKKNVSRSSVVCANVLDFIKSTDTVYDVILAIDAVEHLERSDAEELIKWMEGHFKKHLIVLTPNIFDDNKEGLTAWKMGRNEYQIHRSLFKEKYWLKRGYSVMEKYYIKKSRKFPNFLYIKSL